MSFDNYLSTLHCRVTDLRRDVLHVLWQADSPLKAYDILQQLRQVRPNAEPPTAYRVLDFLVEQNIVHRLDNSQSYMICHSSEKHEIGKQVIMLCEKCHETIEVSNAVLQTLLTEMAKSHNFTLNKNIVELTGWCNSCIS